MLFPLLEERIFSLPVFFLPEFTREEGLAEVNTLDELLVGLADGFCRVSEESKLLLEFSTLVSASSSQIDLGLNHFDHLVLSSQQMIDWSHRFRCHLHLPRLLLLSPQ